MDGLLREGSGPGMPGLRGGSPTGFALPQAGTAACGQAALQAPICVMRRAGCPLMSGQPDAVRENFAVQRDHGAVLVGVDLSAHFLAVGGCVIEHIIEEGARGQPDLDICQHIRVCPVAKAHQAMS